MKDFLFCGYLFEKVYTTYDAVSHKNLTSPFFFEERYIMDDLVTSILKWKQVGPKGGIFLVLDIKNPYDGLFVRQNLQLL